MVSSFFFHHTRYATNNKKRQIPHFANRRGGFVVYWQEKLLPYFIFALRNLVHSSKVLNTWFSGTSSGMQSIEVSIYMG